MSAFMMDATLPIAASHHKRKRARHLGIDVTVHPRGRPDDVEIVLLLFCGKQGLEFVRRRG